MQALVTPDRFDAVLFDMDGVLTTTTRMHAVAWKHTFDEFLERWDAEHATITPRFSITEDYPATVDGKPRYDGVRAFLRSRGIELAEGSPDSPATELSVHGIGNRKQELVEEALRTEGVEAFPGSVAWVRELRDQGISTAVVTSSQNCLDVLDAAGIRELFDAKVDGRDAIELGLQGKPAPDTFLEAARRLGVEAARCAVVEDARAGVRAARAGGFGLVIGVDRADHAEALRSEGADVVVDDLAEFVTSAADTHHPLGPKVHRLIAAGTRLLAAQGDFPVDEHRIVERRFNREYVPQLETIFALANGYMGLRGAHDEGRPVYDPAPCINRFYETWPIVYPEHAYGFAHTGQTAVGVPDGGVIRLYVDDEPFDLEHVEILDYERALDMNDGTVERRVRWRSADGSRFELRSRRLVSLEYRHLACIEYEVTSLDRPAHLTISSELVLHTDERDLEIADPRRSRRMPPDVLQLMSQREQGDRVVVCWRTRTSDMRLGCGIDHDLSAGVPVDHPQTIFDERETRVLYRVEAVPTRPVRLVKYVAYHHGSTTALPELAFRVSETLDRARRSGFDKVLASQRARLADFWERSDVRSERAPLMQQAIRFNLFQLLQASARVERYAIPAKGLTGRGYEGHYFWDTEIYVMPFLTYTAPQIAKSLLRHRYEMLDRARQRARTLGHRGAMFPWRTISGEEASAYYAAGTAQYHINADIAYAMCQYVRATDDLDFLARYGVEILVETARFWDDLGFFSDRKDGRFVINGVTGPDEYSTVVDNNTFTNLLAQENLRQAVKSLAWLAETDPSAHARLVERTGLAPGEPARWKRAAELMYVPYDEREQLHLQDDGFLDRECWDFEGTPADHYPLLLHYHPLVIYRHQVIKQADVVLATFLLGEAFTDEDKRRILEYYDPLTTGDSSLSESIQSIMAAEIGDLRAAEEYFFDSVSVDLADTAGNVRDGIHVASAGGTWMALVFGFAGMRDRGPELSFRPRLPERMGNLSFSVQAHGATLRVEIRSDSATYRLTSGTELPIRHNGELLSVVAGQEVTRPIPRLRRRDAPTLARSARAALKGA